MRNASCEYEGIPFDGTPADLAFIKQEDSDHRKPVLKSRVVVRVFHMEDGEHQEAYTGVCNEIARGWSYCVYESVQYVSAKRTWDVFLKWIEFTYVKNTEKKGTTDNGKSTDLAEPTPNGGAETGTGGNEIAEIIYRCLQDQRGMVHDGADDAAASGGAGPGNRKGHEGDCERGQSDAQPGS